MNLGERKTDREPISLKQHAFIILWEEALVRHDIKPKLSFGVDVACRHYLSKIASDGT